MTQKTPLPDALILRAVLRYEPETGKLFWLARAVETFTEGSQGRAHSAAIWNGQNAGREAFTSLSSSGYRRGTVLGVHYVAHRIAWKIVTGDDPDEIDHIDGNRSNNAWTNLRAVDRTSNLRNMSRSRRNTSGVLGVSMNKYGTRWRAYAWDGTKQVRLGEFANKEDAAQARRLWSIVNGYHSGHGKPKL